MGSSWFLQTLLPRQILLSPAPGYAPVLTTKPVYRDKFLAPIKIVPRHCASAPNKNPVP